MLGTLASLWELARGIIGRGTDGTTELRQHPVEGGEGCKCPSCMVSKVSFWLILEEVITEGLGPVTLYISCAWDKHGIPWFWTLALPGL